MTNAINLCVIIYPRYHEENNCLLTDLFDSCWVAVRVTPQHQHWHLLTQPPPLTTTTTVGRKRKKEKILELILNLNQIFVKVLRVNQQVSRSTLQPIAHPSRLGHYRTGCILPRWPQLRDSYALLLVHPFLISVSQPVSPSSLHPSTTSIRIHALQSNRRCVIYTGS